MNIVPVFMDIRLSYGGRAPLTLLTAPLADATLLRYLYERVREATAVAPAVLTTFAIDDAYRAALSAAGAPIGQLLRATQFAELLDAHEPADRLLLIDARWFPEGGLDLGGMDLRSAASYAPRYFAPLQRDAAGTREYLQIDADGQVRKIQRFYDGVTRLRTLGVLCATMGVAAARAAAGAAFASLTELREVLAARRTLSQDVPLEGAMIDLTQEQGLLALNEHLLRHGGRCDSSRLTQNAPGIHVGEGVRVDPGARLVGPLILQRGARVERGATLVGPMVVGPDAHICENAALAHCLVLPGATIQARATLRQRVVSGETAGDAAEELRSTARPTYRAGGEAGGECAHAGSTYPGVKRAIDVAVSFAALLLLAPLLGLVAVLVRLTSPGPICFVDEREGRDGQVFRCYKFRTMRHNAHLLQRTLYSSNEVDGPQFKMKRDPRITSLGHFLRKSNLDELPQLWNVLTGDMSLIGPRPSPFRENQICVAWRHARLSVRPGITGLWQICRHDRDQGDFHQWIHFDTLYVRRLSFALDARIFLATLATLGGRFSVPVSWIVPHADAAGDFELLLAAHPMSLE